MNNQIQKETSNGFEKLYVTDYLNGKRKIFINGPINMEMANDILQLMFILEKEPEEIDVFINSPGGEVNAGLLIYDIFMQSKNPINIYAVGMAASMAAIILASGQKGRRFILPHSQVMIHEVLISGGVGGSATSISKISDSIMSKRTLLNGILASHTGRTIEEINEATSFDNYMSAEEAIDFGICDEVCTSILKKNQVTL